MHKKPKLRDSPVMIAEQFSLIESRLKTVSSCQRKSSSCGKDGGGKCVRLSETRRQEVVGEPRVISLYACRHVHEVDLWVTDSCERAVLAVSITGRLMWRDATRQNWGGWRFLPSRSHDGRGNTPAQATTQIAVSRLDVCFATRRKGLDLYQPNGTPLPPLRWAFQLWSNVTIAFIRRVSAFLHGQTRPHDALGQAGDLPIAASREDFHAAGEVADNVIEINPAPLTGAFLFENGQRVGEETVHPRARWIHTGCLLQNVLNLFKCQKETLSPVHHAESTHLQSEPAVNQPRITVFSSGASNRSSIYCYFFQPDSSSNDFLLSTIYYVVFLFVCNLLDAHGRMKKAGTSRWGINDKTENHWESPGSNEQNALDKLGILAQAFDVATGKWEVWPDMLPLRGIGYSCAITSPGKEMQNQKQIRKQN